MARAKSQIARYLKLRSATLLKYEEFAKMAVPHRGEKGRVVEGALRAALRQILPTKFGIGSGFIITADGRTSSQLDIIIYDSIFNSPIALEGGVGLFPIEAVYGFVEVKSRLDAKGIADFTKAVGRIRLLAKAKRYVQFYPRDVGGGKLVSIQADIPLDLPPRSFAFCVDCSLSTVATLRKRLVDDGSANGAHIHGFAVLKRDWFLAQLPYRKRAEFRVYTKSAFEKFSVAVLNSVLSFPMLPAAMDRYLINGKL